LLRRLGCLRGATREADQIPGTGLRFEGRRPHLFVELARALQGDARYLEQAKRQLKRGLRLRPMDSNAISVFADLLWEDGKRDEATEFYRFAANLEGFKLYASVVYRVPADTPNG
jgi:hypothetical protein